MAVENEDLIPVDKNEFWRGEEFSPLINKNEMHKIASEDPWQYDLTSKLKNFLFRMEARKSVNFRVSGIILHSASYLLNKKSQSMVDTGSQIQESLSETDCFFDEFLDEQTSNGILTDAPSLNDDGMALDPLLKTGDKNLDSLIGILSARCGPEGRLLSKKKLEKLNIPRRVVAKPLTMSDLSIALGDALKGKFRKRAGKKEIKDIVLPESIKNSYNEELKIEHIIDLLKERVHEDFTRKQEPVFFPDLIDNPSITLVVRTFMAMLHMINKKVIEVWQIESGDIYVVPFGKSSEFWIEE
ncbi:MAG: hypothetical protein ACFFCS_09025 [Candidatus Hodarchaeota archaeon]